MSLWNGYSAPAFCRPMSATVNVLLECHANSIHRPFSWMRLLPGSASNSSVSRTECTLSFYPTGQLSSPCHPSHVVCVCWVGGRGRRTLRSLTQPPLAPTRKVSRQPAPTANPVARPVGAPNHCIASALLYCNTSPPPPSLSLSLRLSLFLSFPSASCNSA